ncbi:MAG: Hsp20 family protein, partial [Methylococcales bacterium]|nr:Hsp20 family protein [Methylococcales bacterium]
GIDPNLLDVAVKDQRLFIKSTASKIVTNQSANSTSYSYSSNQFQQSYSIPHNVNLQKMAIERSAELVRVILPKIKQ